MTDDHERHYQQAAKEILAPAFEWWVKDVIDNATLMALMSRMIGAEVYDPALRGMLTRLGQGTNSPTTTGAPVADIAPAPATMTGAQAKRQGGK